MHPDLNGWLLYSVFLSPPAPPPLSACRRSEVLVNFAAQNELLIYRLGKSIVRAAIMLRVDPADFARKRAEMREGARLKKTQMVEMELQQHSFKPESFTRRRGSVDKPPSQVSLESQVQAQLATTDIFEAPLPATLKRLNMDKGTDSNGGGADSSRKTGDSGNAVNAKGVVKSLYREVTEDVENVSNGAVYKPRESYESMDLRGNGRSNKGASQADADAAFQLSLRTEEAGYNIDAVVPMGTRPTASNRAKGGGKLALSSSRRRASADSVPAIASPVTYNSPQKDKRPSPVMRPTPETPPSMAQNGRSDAMSNMSTYLSPPPAAAATTGDTGVGMSSGKKSAGAGTGTGGKSRPSSAGTPRSAKKVSPLKFSSPPHNTKTGSHEKRQARSRLSLLKSKMPPRKSESARPSRPAAAAAAPGQALSPAAGAKERRRASLSAAVRKFNTETGFTGDDEEKGRGHEQEQEKDVSLGVSASESHLHRSSVPGDISERMTYQPEDKPPRGGAAPVVHKATRLDRPTLRARRSIDLEGFNPVTGEPLSPTPTAPPSRTLTSSPERERAEVGKDKEGKEVQQATHTQQPYTVQQSIEIHHKTDAESTVPKIFIDLPEDAFSTVENTGGNLFQCPHCVRKFNETALSRHVKVCKTVFLEKPKVFNSSRMRISGVAKINKADNTEMMILEGAVSVTAGSQSTSINSPTAARMARKKREREEKERTRKAKKESSATAPAGGAVSGGGAGDAKAGKWKSQSMALRRAMLEARGKSTKGLGDDLDMGVVDSLVPCPHCSRKFNQKAADRHIPQCQSIKAKPKTLKKNTGMSAVAKAKKGTTGRKVATRIL